MTSSLNLHRHPSNSPTDCDGCPLPTKTHGKMNGVCQIWIGQKEEMGDDHKLESNILGRNPKTQEEIPNHTKKSQKKIRKIFKKKIVQTVSGKNYNKFLPAPPKSPLPKKISPPQKIKFEKNLKINCRIFSIQCFNF